MGVNNALEVLFEVSLPHKTLTTRVQSEFEMAYSTYRRYYGPVRNPALEIILTKVKIIDDHDGFGR